MTDALEIKIREYAPADAPTLFNIFYNTIRNINIRDYSHAQVEAWASDEVNPALWRQRMDGINPFLAIHVNQVVGYADLQPNGLIDHFFCHHEFQGCGVGRTLMTKILTVAREHGLDRLHSEVSMTAKPFYQHFGFKVMSQKSVVMRGQTLTYNLMERLL